MDGMWPACSLASSLSGTQPLFFFFRRHVKSLVYEMPVDSSEDLVARIVVTVHEINATHAIFEKVCELFLRWCQLCNDTRVQYFEHLLRVFH